MVPSQEVIMAAQSAQKKYRVPSSVTIAQYGLESGWGAHIPDNSFNPFGIKANDGEPFVRVLTHEVISGKTVQVYAKFRAYTDLIEAFNDHARLLATAPVYSIAMSLLPDVSAFVTEMARHYATDPNYAKELLNIIQGDNLRIYDE